jgi:Tfp pilus assembly protein PilF
MANTNNKIQKLFQKGLSLQNARNFEDAKVAYEKILIINPNHFDANHLLGVIFYETKDFNKSLDLISKAIEINSKIALPYNNLALTLSELGEQDSAIKSFEIAITLKPDYFEAFYNLGNLLLNKMKAYELAIQSYDQCLKINGNYLQAYLNKGNAYKELNCYELALDSYNHVINIKPDFFDAIYNKGLVLQKMGKHDEARITLERLVHLNPNHIPAKWALSLCQLVLGDFENVLKNYETRFINPELSDSFIQRNLSGAAWSGDQCIQNKKIFIYSEQGLGDTLQFARYCSLLSKLGAKVILETQKPLQNILNGLSGIDQLITTGDEIPNHDFYCPLLTLPLALKTNLSNIPCDDSYISSNQEFLDKWKKFLGPAKKFRIGLIWSGNQHHKNDVNRSISLNSFSKLLNHNNEFFSLQKEVRSTDLEILSNLNEINHLGDKLIDFCDTAAVCDLMDLVITVDTSVAHLSAALGRHTWLLLPFNPDWRWLLNTSKSPWYPTVRIFRQPSPGDWDSVINEVKIALEEKVSTNQIKH